MLFGETMGMITDVIIVIGAVAGALYSVYKIIAPLTKSGQRMIDKKKKRRQAEIEEAAHQATKKALEEKLDEKLEPIEGSIIILSDHIKEVDGKISAIMSLNQEQSAMLNDLDIKVDENEIDRIRWEILAFAKSCRHHSELGSDDFNHIFELHQKYETLLAQQGRTNGQIDVEFQFISNYYLKLSEEGKL